MGTGHNYFSMLAAIIILQACWLWVAELKDIVS